MSLFCDRTGFPVIELPGQGLAIHLLPVAKTQFERYLSETAAWGDQEYQEVLTVSPRVSWRHFTSEDREKVFLTGIRPEEAEAFGAWLGEGWRLPTVHEWRLANQFLSGTPLTQPFLDELAKSGLNSTAAGILSNMLKYAHPKDLGEFCLFKKGVIEWVTHQNNYGGLGETRWEFAPILCQPLQGDPLEPLDRQQRIHYFGARLVCAHPAGPPASPRTAPELIWS
jgi:hypothetical protein